MQYLGGKSRISKQISKILNDNKRDNFVSLFCGTCSVESLVQSVRVVLNDSHPYLIACLKEFQSGREFPENVSEEDYKYTKNNLDVDPALSGFIGFGCSFGAKWWGGYARQKKGLNYASTAKRSLAKKFKTLKCAEIYNLDYKEIKVEEGSFVYCDPPYKGTMNYSNSKDFNHDEFWDYARSLSKKSMVFVSELSAPEDFVPVWEKEFTRNLDARSVFKSSEKLFAHKSLVNEIVVSSVLLEEK